MPHNPIGIRFQRYALRTKFRSRLEVSTTTERAVGKAASKYSGSVQELKVSTPKISLYLTFGIVAQPVLDVASSWVFSHGVSSPSRDILPLLIREKGPGDNGDRDRTMDTQSARDIPSSTSS